MKTFIVPKSLHEVFGERQTWLEVTGVVLFALLGSSLIYGLLYTPIAELSLWRSVIAWLLIADILAGCIANFSRGTSQFYGARASGRWLFISIHFHLIAVAWLLGEPILAMGYIWAYTIAAAIIVNLLQQYRYQLFIAANLIAYGLILIVVLALPSWLMLVSILFMLKVVFSFGVDHFAHERS
ncbi:hypothetical protein [Motilimonas cestriensis]|uniref:hypothetical protein n=1 Tax=Motilimonas cestriensis TaxID=2742685 RepID=UPI003DA5B942